MENVMRMPQSVHDNISLLKTFRDRSDGGQPWFMIPELDTEIGDVFHITDKNKKKLRETKSEKKICQGAGLVSLN